MNDQIKRVLEAQEEVNINIRLPRVKKDAFKKFCAEQSDKIGKTATVSGMITAFIEDCIKEGEK